MVWISQTYCPMASKIGNNSRTSDRHVNIKVLLTNIIIQYYHFLFKDALNTHFLSMLSEQQIWEKA